MFDDVSENRKDRLLELVRELKVELDALPLHTLGTYETYTTGVAELRKTNKLLIKVLREALETMQEQVRRMDYWNKSHEELDGMINDVGDILIHLEETKP
ncbi:MAG: hypothetical protein ACXAEN_17870 [Candidatus Thorarchaeota archaeon]|jgi:hypothetical protein